MLRLLGSLVVTRLLFPELFGLMAVVTTILVGLALFSDVGIGASIVRHPRGLERSFLRTSWTVQVGRGILLWIACIAIAPLSAGVYDDERLLWLLPLVGFTSVLSGLSSTSLHVMRRQVNVRDPALLEFAAQIVGLAVAIGWALIEPGVLALAAGPLAASLVVLAGSHMLNKGDRDGLGWDRDVVRELFHFGKWIFLSTAFTFLASQADRLIIGRLYSLELLGVYNIAFTLADMPRALLIAWAARVLFPMISEVIGGDHAGTLTKIKRPRGQLLLVFAFGLALLIGCGDLMVGLLYDQRYHGAQWMLPILALGVWVSILARSMDSILYAVGKAKLPAVGFALSFAALLAGIIVGDRLAGEIGAMIGIALSPLPHYLFVMHGVKKEGFHPGRQDLGATLALLVFSGALIAARVLLDAPLALFDKVVGGGS